jgi:predicted adenine nucleotide alpha hydrolase (AANH) superfamily ATPase
MAADSVEGKDRSMFEFFYGPGRRPAKDYKRRDAEHKQLMGNAFMAVLFRRFLVDNKKRLNPDFARSLMLRGQRGSCDSCSAQSRH